MEESNKNILLISYTFPPTHGIGGRRWAKFSKYLTKLGYTVHVIQAKNNFNSQSLWLEDVINNKNIIRYEINSGYPNVLTILPKSFLEKLWYKISLLKMLLFTKGSPYDKAVFWNKKMLIKAKELITNYSIKNVVVSCAPFTSAYACLELKKQFRNINLLVDLRDPWTWGKGYGFSTLKLSRLEYEKEMEKSVVNNFDYVLVAYLTMKDFLEHAYPQNSNKIMLLPHAYDEEELKRENKVQYKKIRLLLYGTLYPNIKSTVQKTLDSISNYKNEIELDVYSHNVEYEPIFNNYPQSNKFKINFYKEIEPKVLFSKMKEYNFVLILQPNYAANFISTKIYEILYSKTPIILISDKGELSDLITKNSLGIWIENTTLTKETFNNIDLENITFKIDQFPIHKHSFYVATNQLVKLFK